jgi:hypothetical protein
VEFVERFPSDSCTSPDQHSFANSRASDRSAPAHLLKISNVVVRCSDALNLGFFFLVLSRSYKFLNPRRSFFFAFSKILDPFRCCDPVQSLTTGFRCFQFAEFLFLRCTSGSGWSDLCVPY